MASRVIDVALPKAVTAIFLLHHEARIRGSIPWSPTKLAWVAKPVRPRDGHGW